MDNNLTSNILQSERTNLIRGGTGYPYAPFELKLQLHGEVSNPYNFSIEFSSNVFSDILQTIFYVKFDPITNIDKDNAATFSFIFPQEYNKLIVSVGGTMVGEYFKDTLMSTNTTLMYPDENHNTVQIEVNGKMIGYFWLTSRETITVAFTLE